MFACCAVKEELLFPIPDTKKNPIKKDQIANRFLQWLGKKVEMILDKTAEEFGVKEEADLVKQLAVWARAKGGKNEAQTKKEKEKFYADLRKYSVNQSVQAAKGSCPENVWQCGLGEVLEDDGVQEAIADSVVQKGKKGKKGNAVMDAILKAGKQALKHKFNELLEEIQKSGEHKVEDFLSNLEQDIKKDLADDKHHVKHIEPEVDLDFDHDSSKHHEALKSLIHQHENGELVDFGGEHPFDGHDVGYPHDDPHLHDDGAHHDNPDE